MLVAFLGAVLILHVSSIAGEGSKEFGFPGGVRVLFVTPSQDPSPRPEPHRHHHHQGFQVIQLGGDKGSHNYDKDSNSDVPDGLWDFLKVRNSTGSPGSSGVQVIQLGGDNGPKKGNHHDDDDDEDDPLRKIFKFLRFGSRRGESRPNVQYVKLYGRDLKHRQPLAQARSDYGYPLDASPEPRLQTRVKVIRQNVPRQKLVRSLRSSQAHLTNVQTLSFPVYEDQWQIA